MALTFKEKIIKWHTLYHYPQILFGKKLKAIIEQLNFGDRTIDILDAPCGSGETSIYLSQIPKSRITGVDIGEWYINNARKNFNENENIAFFLSDMYYWLELHKECYDVICVVNSLFLLPDTDKLMELLKGSLRKGGSIIFIIPNAEGSNFLNFHKKNPDINTFILKRNEAEAYFLRKGLKTSEIHELSRAVYNGKEWLNKLSMLRDFYLLGLNMVQDLFKIGKKSYFIFVTNKI